MNFVLLRAEYDRHKERAYVEFRGPDEDGGDAIATAIFSYRTTDANLIATRCMDGESKNAETA